MIQRLNPGPGLVDFWTEFKRPNPYRWPILGGSALLTGSLLFLLTDHAVSLNWIVGGVLALIAGVALAAVIAERVRIRFGVLLSAAVLTTVLLYQFTKERVIVPPRPPQVTFISTFAEGRSDAEIAASNLANQKVQERLRAEQARREEEAKNAYRALGRATGIDVDAMERQIARDRAREAKPGSGVAAQPR
ncbi:hypothetical protein [Tsuneonella deserti]|nr:hypothetical protein [Tsuneonella deserti]